MTNKEIARQINVSPATLSLVINNKPGISQATRAKVLQKLEEMGLQHLIKSEEPEDTAAPVQENNTFCFVVYKRDGDILDRHPFFQLITEGVERCARSHGYNLMFLFIDRRNSVKEQIALLRTMNCQGAVIFGTEMLEDDVSFFKDLPFPYVILDNDFPYGNVDTVAINNQLGCMQAVDYLVRMGHKEIGYLKSRSRINSFAERADAYRESLAYFDLPLEEEFVFELDYSREGSFQEFRHYLQNGAKLPTAFVTDDDTIASGVLMALHEAGIRVPEDVSIVGFNDRPLCEVCEPKLTTIRVPRYTFAAMAIELLINRTNDHEIQGEAVRSLKYRVGTDLLIRDSVQRISE